MKKLLNITIACSMTLMLGACSSGPTTEGENGEPAAAPAADAATDAVPQATAENGATPAVDGAPAAAVPPGAADPALTAAATPGAVTPAADNTALAAVPPPATTPSAGAVDPAVAVQPSPPGNGTFDNYTVQTGDTLMKVAFETYGDLYRWKSILEANKDKVTDPNRIPAGTVLKVEKPSSPVSVEKNGEKYMIKTGDTLGTISSDVYHTKSKWKTLWENNKQMIHDPNRIFAGFYLYYQPTDGPKSADPSSTVTPAPMAGNQPTAERTPASAVVAPPAGQ